MTNCVNCKSVNETEADGMYEGYMKCADCGFLKTTKVVTPNGIINQPTSKVILPDDPMDPMDAMMCESCQ